MKRNGPHGFSLIELLVVLAIIAVLATASIIAFTSIARGRSLTKAAGDLAGILELSRSYAMANNSAVLVTVEPSDNPQNLLVQVSEQRPGETNSKALQRKRTFENITANISTNITTTPDPSDLTIFRFNSRGELTTTNSIPIQTLKIVVTPQIATSNNSNNATISVAGLTGAISVTY